MVHLIAILFFSGVIVGLALVLQATVRDHWPDMVAALFGRPLPSRAVRRPAAVRASVPRSRKLPAAA